MTVVAFATSLPELIVSLNAAINGLSKKEIDLRFDDIIEFSSYKKGIEILVKYEVSV